MCKKPFTGTVIWIAIAAIAVVHVELIVELVARHVPVLDLEKVKEHYITNIDLSSGFIHFWQQVVNCPVGAAVCLIGIITFCLVNIYWGKKNEAETDVLVKNS